MYVLFVMLPHREIYEQIDYWCVIYDAPTFINLWTSCWWFMKRSFFYFFIAVCICVFKKQHFFLCYNCLPSHLVSGLSAGRLVTEAVILKSGGSLIYVCSAGDLAFLFH